MDNAYTGYGKAWLLLMKKAGQFFFTFIPLILVTAMQYIAVFFALGVSGLIRIIWYTTTDTGDFLDFYNDVFSIFMTQDFSTWIMIIYAMLSIVIFGLWYYIKYNGNYLPKPKSVFHPLSVIGVIMLVPGSQYLCTYIVSFTASLFPHSLDAYESLIESAGLDNSVTVAMFLYSVILAPFSEELIFRGVTMHQAKKCMPFWLANLIQALLFGIFHMNLIQGVYAFCLGLILGYICEKSGSIYNAILLHLLFNFWGTIISQYLSIGDSIFSFLFWFIFGLVMTAGGIFVFRLGTKRFAATAVPKSIPAPASQVI